MFLDRGKLKLSKLSWMGIIFLLLLSAQLLFVSTSTAAVTNALCICDNVARTCTNYTEDEAAAEETCTDTCAPDDYNTYFTSPQPITCSDYCVANPSECQFDPGLTEGKTGTGDAQVSELTNPIGGTSENKKGEVNLIVIIGLLIKSSIAILGSLVLLVFVVGGVMWLTSAGNPERVKKGTHTMLYAVIGLFVIFSAYAILNTIIKGLAG